MKKNKIVNVILSGGSGTRLWPLSRQNKPKQFLKIFDKKSLFQHTIERNNLIVDEFLLITNSLQITEAEMQVKEIGCPIFDKIIEPVGRNTAPAIALAALALDKDDVLLVTPSDHMVSDFELYANKMKRAIQLANNDFLVTFGIKPTEANTGFGYIEFNNEDVVSFREKPDKETAKQFLKNGNFSWNSGMFCFKASVFLEELKKHNLEMFNACFEAYKNISNSTIDLEDMKKIPSDSIDYAVMEKSNKIKTISSDFYWTDLGTFDAIVNYFEEDKKVDSLKKNENKSFFFSKKEVFTNLENLIIIDTDDVIVILEKGKTNEIKNIYNKVKGELPNLTN